MSSPVKEIWVFDRLGICRIADRGVQNHGDQQWAPLQRRRFQEQKIDLCQLVSFKLVPRWPFLAVLWAVYYVIMHRPASQLHVLSMTFMWDTRTRWAAAVDYLKNYNLIVIQDFDQMFSGPKSPRAPELLFWFWESSFHTSLAHHPNNSQTSPVFALCLPIQLILQPTNQIRWWTRMHSWQLRFEDEFQKQKPKADPESDHLLPLSRSSSIKACV